jgi:hypothetical protein
MENDGTLSIRDKDNGYKQIACGICTSSPYLVEQFYRILRILGIRYTLAVKTATDVSHEGYQLWLSGTDIKQAVLSGKLNFHSAEARAWVDQVKTLPTKDDVEKYDPVPVARPVAALLIAAVKDTDWASKYAYIRNLKAGYVSRAMAKTILNEFEFVSASRSVNDQLAAWSSLVDNDDITWDKIDKVERIENQDVFDLVVPSTKVFAVNNGLVIYDTASVHVPITKGEIDNLRKRLMPSKMLLSPADFKSPMYAPNQDFMLGISLASLKRNKRRAPKVFMTEADAERALERGEIDWHDPVKILEDK